MNRRSPRSVPLDLDPIGPFLLPAGRYPAFLFAVIDLGTHLLDYGSVRREVRQTLLCWQTGVVRPDGSPHVVNQTYTMAYYPGSRLMTLIDQWRGPGYFPTREVKLETLIGAVAMLLIEYAVSGAGNRFANLVGVQPLLRTEGPPPEPKFEPFHYRIRDGQPPHFSWQPSVFGQPACEYIEDSRERRNVRAGIARRSRKPPQNLDR